MRARAIDSSLNVDPGLQNDDGIVELRPEMAEFDFEGPWVYITFLLSSVQGPFALSDRIPKRVQALSSN
jgi:hypothetical protein